MVSMAGAIQTVTHKLLYKVLLANQWIIQFLLILYSTKVLSQLGFFDESIQLNLQQNRLNQVRVKNINSFELTDNQMDAPPLSEQELTDVYNWVDQLPLSRPKKNITRDFSDGVLMAEVISHYLPKLVELHNYISSSSANTKLANWNTLNKKVLKKLNYQISKNDIDHIITCTPDIIERVLKMTQLKIKNFIEKKRNTNQKEQKYQGEKEVQQKKITQNNQLKDVLLQKDNTIKELKSTVEILELKIQKMEQLLKIKDNKIQSLVTKLQQAGIA